jgi:hypothetical protein
MDITQIGQALWYGGLQAFGVVMPMLAPDWLTSSGSFTVADQTPASASDPSIMTMTASANWAAPFAASYLVLSDNQLLPASLAQADGVAETSPGVLLTMLDQAWLRLGRLYCEILQSSDTSRPERERGQSSRPVPRYIFFPGQAQLVALPPGGITMGLVRAGDDLGLTGQARFYDSDGLQIDPVAVMACFETILTHYPGLQAIPLGSAPADTLPLTNYLSTLASEKVTRVRLVDAAGKPYTDTSHLKGLTQVDATSALFKMEDSTTGVTVEDASDTFLQFDHDRLLVGSACNGRLSRSFIPPTLQSSPSVTLKRDYYTLRVIELQSYLNGQWPNSNDDPAVTVQRQVPVRINENITFLLDGNDVLGAVHSALDSGSPSKSNNFSPPESDLTLVVAQSIDGNFPIPTTSGQSAHWPLFPPGISVDQSATLSINLKDQVALFASWTTTTANATGLGNVMLEIAGLPPAAWVRVYPRLFSPDANTTRGDGQGREVPSSGTVVMALTDPLSLRDPLTGKVALPSSATLQFDMVVILPNAQTRIYGGLSVSVGATVITSPPLSLDSGSNPCGMAKFQGVNSAGILGLGHTGKISPSPTSLVQWAEALTGEGTPRDAPRMPTMARRELLVAGAGSDTASGSPAFARTWKGVIGGGRIDPETVCASSRIGAPGSFGGRETTVVGAATQGGILAYDIARHALRRSQDIIPRMVTLASASWNVPDEPTAVALGKQAGASNGTMAGALLQTVAPFCESPELDGLWDIDVVSNAVTEWITTNVTNGSEITEQLQKLQNSPMPPQPAQELQPTGLLGQELDDARRLAIELERELTSERYGRRDAQWALQSAIGNARHFIYIETPGFASTLQGVASPPVVKGYMVDLIAALTTQMKKMPGLRVVVCVNKNPDFAPGYEGMASYEVQDRLSIVRAMPAALTSPPESEQFLLFHPIGFPGRFARVETNVVIVDDIWAMVGGSSFRRRGLTFDGSSDLVLTDTQLEHGRSVAIRDFRRGLMANRLGIATDSTQSSYVALSEARTAFSVFQEALSGSGSGKMTVVWDGTTPGVTPAPVLTADEANPEGRDFNEFAAAAVSLLADASGV